MAEAHGFGRSETDVHGRPQRVVFSPFPGAANTGSVQFTNRAAGSLYGQESAKARSARTGHCGYYFDCSIADTDAIVGSDDLHQREVAMTPDRATKWAETRKQGQWSLSGALAF